MKPIDLDTAALAAGSDSVKAAVEPAAPALKMPSDAIGAEPTETEFRAKATAAAEKFESFFISQMLKQMRASTAQFADEGSPFKDPINADMLGLADGLLADRMSGQHAFGIADAILRQLLPAPQAPAISSPSTPNVTTSGETRFNAGPPAVASSP